MRPGGPSGRWHLSPAAQEPRCRPFLRFPHGQHRLISRPRRAQVPGERFLQRAYDELKLCCHPDFSAHPRRREGLAKLTEAYETLSDRNGTRDEVVAAFVAEGVERERRMAAAGPSAGAVADSAASMAESMAARMRQKLADQKMAARKQAGTGGGRGGTASPPEGLSAGPARAPTPRGVAEAGGSESEDEATREARRVARRGAAQQAGRKKRRVGAL